MINLFKRLGMSYKKMSVCEVVDRCVFYYFTMQMECCGVDHFTDYETVFSNFSVPVSCCNTTNPLASECPDIVRNSQRMINQTGLIYSEVSACCSVAIIFSLTHYLLL